MNRNAAQAMNDQELVDAYVKDEAQSDFGVNYFLAQEMQARKFRNPKTAELTREGKRIAAAVQS